MTDIRDDLRRIRRERRDRRLLRFYCAVSTALNVALAVMLLQRA